MLVDTFVIAAMAALALLVLTGDGTAQSVRLHRRIGQGWRFHRGDAPGAQAPDFDDTSWRIVDLPHDWSIEDLPPLEAEAPEVELCEEAPTSPRVRSGPFDSSSVGGGAVGYTVGGVGWYRKTFVVPESFRGRRLFVLFEGIYMCAEVWINGVPLGSHAYGYTSFHLDLTPGLRYGEPNVLAVRVDTSGKTSRWYAGSGIYRHVWLTATGPVRVAQWGIAVSTPEVRAHDALVCVKTALRNAGETAVKAAISHHVLDGGGEVVAHGEEHSALESGAQVTVPVELRVVSPALWSPDTPALYRLVTRVHVGDEVVDEIETPFGIRSFAIDAGSGFVLNGRPMKLRGGCVHHDNGPLGACAYDRAEERRVELLKAAGFNAVRTAHNPPSPAFLDACDRLGMLVLDEAFDCWKLGKNPEDYHRFFDGNWRDDLASMVLRDRNHPCIFAWSIGNEVTEQVNAEAEGADLAGELAATVRELDPTRMVAIGAHPGTDPWEKLDPLFAHLDLCGYNYKWERYSPDHQRVPARVVAGTESFPNRCFESWMATVDSPYVIGDFVWTSLDYLGEVALGHTHYEGDPNQYAAWPWTAANCGDLDICGFRRPQSYYREIAFGEPNRIACFVATPVPEGRQEVVYGWGWPNEWPSWTWPGSEGRPLSVRVYSSCPRVRLLLNGRDLGEKPTGRETRFTATWEVPYEPGRLAALGLDERGDEVAQWALRTAGPPAAVALVPDRAALRADGQDLAFVTVKLLDRDGMLNPNADELVHFDLQGPGSIVAVASSDPRSVESFRQPQRRAWRGRALAIVKAKEQAGVLKLRAEAEGLAAGEAAIVVGG